MKRFMVLGVVISATVLTAAVPAYAQRWGRGATPREGVCLYQDINFGGPYFCSPTGVATSEVPNGTNDRISSIRIFGDAAVTVYRDPNMRGQSRVISSDMNDLRSLGFNDRISSYQVESYRGNNGNYRNNGNGNYRNNGNGDYRNNGNGGYRGNSGRAVSRSNNPPYGTVQNGTRWNYRDAESVVRRSYRSILGRDPDPSGLRNWTEQVVNNNWTQQDLEYNLRQSDEYRQLRDNRRR